MLGKKLYACAYFVKKRPHFDFSTVGWGLLTKLGVISGSKNGQNPELG
jgi:hypothetical protein